MGKTTQSLLDQYCYIIWHNKNEACPNCPVIETFQTKQKAEREIKTHNDLIYYLRAYPAFNKKREFIGVVELGLDITRKKELEGKLKL